MSRLGSFHLIEHTADMGLEASGASRAELFLQAARALRAILALSEGECRQTQAIEIKGADIAELLVKWLNEILFLLETRGFFPVDFQVEEVTEDTVRASIIGEPFDPERHGIEREVKAVTYHQLRVEKSAGVWNARLYVDL